MHLKAVRFAAVVQLAFTRRLRRPRFVLVALWAFIRPEQAQHLVSRVPPDIFLRRLELQVFPVFCARRVNTRRVRLLRALVAPPACFLTKQAQLPVSHVPPASSLRRFEPVPALAAPRVSILLYRKAPRLLFA